MLRRSHAEGQAIVLVTHDHRVAAAADRALVMQDGAIRDERTLDTTAADGGALLTNLLPLESV